MSKSCCGPLPHASPCPSCGKACSFPQGGSCICPAPCGSCCPPDSCNSCAPSCHPCGPCRPVCDPCKPSGSACKPPCDPCYERSRPCGQPFPYLVQCILGCGKLHKARQCYLLDFPASCTCGDQSAITSVSVSGPPTWQELPCCRKNTLLLLVRIPLQVQFQDSCGGCFTKESSIEEELSLRILAPESHLWRGQIQVQACARLRGPSRPCKNQWQVPLEIMLEGYLTAPCAVGCPEVPLCPQPRPWYPELDAGHF